MDAGVLPTAETREVGPDAGIDAGVVVPDEGAGEDIRGRFSGDAVRLGHRRIDPSADSQPGSSDNK